MKFYKLVAVKLSKFAATYLSVFVILAILINFFMGDVVYASDLRVIANGSNIRNYQVTMENPVQKLFDIENARPGDEFEATLTIRNSSNTDMRLSMTMAATVSASPDLASVTRIKVETVNGASTNLLVDRFLREFSMDGVSNEVTLLTIAPGNEQSFSFTLILTGDMIPNLYQGTAMEFLLTLLCEFDDAVVTSPSPPPTTSPGRQDFFQVITGGNYTSPPTTQPEGPIIVVDSDVEPEGQPEITPKDDETEKGIIIEITDEPQGEPKINPKTGKAITYSFECTMILMILTSSVWALCNKKKISELLVKNEK